MVKVCLPVAERGSAATDIILTACVVNIWSDSYILLFNLFGKIFILLKSAMLLLSILFGEVSS
jgi:hypothetical protein